MADEQGDLQDVVAALGAGRVAGHFILRRRRSGTVTAVTISPAAVTVQINETAEFTAQVTLANTTDTSSTTTIVTWYVNGVAGGSAATGTIGTSTLDQLVGVYTAPATVPDVNSGEVNITATTPQVPGSTTNVNLITSNTAVATIGIGTGLSVSPLTGTVPAGGSLQFTAILNNVATTQGITWSVSSTAGGNIGTISPTGLYTAPPSPPPGNTVTITAEDTTTSTTATATATILFSNASLTGPFTFSYTGNDNSGFTAVAGSFVADGQGHIVSGVEDSDSFSTGVAKQVPFTGTYVVGPDGRTSVKLNVGSGSGAGQGTPQTWQLAMANFQHGVLTRFDAGNTGSGTVDQQNLNGLTTALTTLSGPYVFKVAGADAEFFPQGMAGKFSANGAGSITGGSPILDVNNSSNPAGGVSKEDRSLAGTYTLDATFPGSGRGTLTLSSTSTGPIQYAFYIVNTTASEQSTQLHLVEIDTANYLAGDVYAAPTGSSFNDASLATGNYPFTVGGTSPTGAYAAGGVFISSGSGGTSGLLDSNNAGTVTTDTTLGTCTYTVDPTSGRIDLLLSTASGTCAAGPSSTTQEFAMYQTALGSAVMLELDATAVTTGTAFVQANSSSRCGWKRFVWNGRAGNFPQSDGALSAESVGAGDLERIGGPLGKCRHQQFQRGVSDRPDFHNGHDAWDAGCDERAWHGDDPGDESECHIQRGVLRDQRHYGAAAGHGYDARADRKH